MTGGAPAHGLPSTGEHIPSKAPPPEPAKIITAQGDKRIHCSWPSDDAVLKYGDFAKAAYDSFDPSGGASLHGLRRLFPEHGLEGHGYIATAFLYANVDLVRRITCDNRRYWIGYVAVARDAERDSDIDGYRDIVVVWRGTSSSLEMIKDFQMSRVPIHEGLGTTKPGAHVEVEQGFHSVYVDSCDSGACQEHSGKLSAQTQVIKELKRLVAHLRARIPAEEKIRVTVTGHSLGGALALLTAWDAAEVLTGVPVRAVTFGAPRVGNQAFCDELVTSRGVQVLRVVVNKDPVPDMPRESMGYAHPGEVIVLDADTSIRETKTWGSQLNIFVMLLPWRFHKFDLYLRLLYGRYGVTRPFGCNKSRSISMPVAKVDIFSRIRTLRIFVLSTKAKEDMEMRLDRLEESELDRMISPPKEEMEKLANNVI